MTERELLQREIATILDHPNVYTPGPDLISMRRADQIIEHLAKSKLLLSALAYGERANKEGK